MGPIAFVVVSAIVFTHLVPLFVLGCEPVSLPQYNALKDLYYATNGPDWTYTISNGRSAWNFTSGSDPCCNLWEGVSCYITVSVVYSLDLYDFGMVGPIPSSVGNLTNITYLDISSNSLYGTIPTSIGKMTSLSTLYADSNALSGTLPGDLLALPSLQIFEVYSNNLTGNVLDQLNWTNLVKLELYNNEFTGTIPSNVKFAASMQKFFLENNKFNGTLPEEIGNMNQLTYFDITGNNFWGTLPSSIANYTQIISFFVGRNNFTGTVPPKFLSIASLQDISFIVNQFSGRILEYLSWTKLQRLRLRVNHFTGTIPQTIQKALNLKFLKIQNNSFTGPLPVGMNMLSVLKAASLSNNTFTGTLPSLAGLTAIQQFLISNNRLEGTLPYGMCNWTSIVSLVAYNNSFTGTLPACLPNLPSIREVILNDNRLTGTIPSGFGFAASLLGLSLESNLLTGSLPQDVVFVLYVFLNNNLLTGTLPAVPQETSAASSVIALDVSNNVMTGSLYSLSTMVSLVAAMLHSNRFTGSLAFMDQPSFALRNLTIIDVTNNRITGSLPSALFSNAVALQSFIADQNCFTGSIPSSVCEATALSQLSLNGLHTASSCTRSFLKGYFLLDDFTGTIPACIYAMPNLTTFLASSNAIISSFPADVAVGPALRNLILSYNVLSGSIPQAIQNHSWELLDLSNNHLIGTLSDNICSHQTQECTLRLDVNRLSGRIPSSLASAPSINILKGNYFTCNVDRSDLPAHDTDREQFVCGSNDANIGLYIFAAVGGLFVLATIVISFEFELYSKVYAAAVALYKRRALCLAATTTLATSAYPNIYKVVTLMRHISRSAVVFTAGIVAVMVVAYGVLKVWYSTATYQEAWYISAAFVSGFVPAVVLAVLFMLWILAFTAWRQGFAPVAAATTVAADSLATAGASTQNVAASPGFHATQMAVVCFNVGFMLAVNIAFVYYMTEDSSATNNAVSRVFLSIAVALLKISWTSYVVPYTLKKGYHYTVEGDAQFHHPSSTILMTWIVILNNIVTPIIAAALFSTECLYHLLIQSPPPVLTSVQISSIRPYANARNILCQTFSFCLETTKGVTSAIAPPFIYSFQCSNSMLQKYAGVFIAMGIMETFGKPILLYAVKNAYRAAAVDGSWYFWLLDSTISPMLRRCDGRSNPYFPQHDFVVSMVYQWTVLLLLGVIFPPIAVTSCCAILSHLLVIRLQLGSILLDAQNGSLDAMRLLDDVNLQTSSISGVLYQGFIAPLLFAALAYGAFVADTLDSYSLGGSFFLVIIVLCSPVLAWIAVRGYDGGYCRRFQTKEPGDRHEITTEHNPVLRISRSSYGPSSGTSSTQHQKKEFEQDSSF